MCMLYLFNEINKTNHSKGEHAASMSNWESIHIEFFFQKDPKIERKLRLLVTNACYRSMEQHTETLVHRVV